MFSPAWHEQVFNAAMYAVTENPQGDELFLTEVSLAPYLLIKSTHCPLHREMIWGASTVSTIPESIGVGWNMPSNKEV